MKSLPDVLLLVSVWGRGKDKKAVRLLIKGAESYSRAATI